jgi:hypothetical protein
LIEAKARLACIKDEVSRLKSSLLCSVDDKLFVMESMIAKIDSLQSLVDWDEFSRSSPIVFGVPSHRVVRYQPVYKIQDAPIQFSSSGHQNCNLGSLTIDEAKLTTIDHQLPDGRLMHAVMGNDIEMDSELETDVVMGESGESESGAPAISCPTELNDTVEHSLDSLERYSLQAQQTNSDLSLVTEGQMKPAVDNAEGAIVGHFEVNESLPQEEEYVQEAAQAQDTVLIEEGKDDDASCGMSFQEESEESPNDMDLRAENIMHCELQISSPGELELAMLQSQQRDSFKRNSSCSSSVPSEAQELRNEENCALKLSEPQMHDKRNAENINKALGMEGELIIKLETESGLVQRHLIQSDQEVGTYPDEQSEM